ncbi:16S rRNA (guanine(1207)-N(2))-methyltransferase RsmC [Pantoea sp. Aalb]|uniref:16S rRNA (guanine(1207)-N(2))-methyltransferase RsmC n=1 Tax=Pantoea sp. Aalb TaxID=2576762 RepID=UPI001321C597|nr:16S rRNA (guanine(1207)-N(2))-methyltransferase RsmC [Pantoea sp. Aalb]MXP67851.1 16S rRNA (guanine(1207)-N(2))-methyltransferase RsmC [Pantoea sp. Aalb]
MSEFTLSSKMILRHSKKFTTRNVLFASNIRDYLPIILKTASTRFHTQQYHYWQNLRHHLGTRAVYSLVARSVDVQGCDTLVYFWSKNKLESQFQLQNLLSLLPIGCDIFIVGENRSGINSGILMFKKWMRFVKIDNARHSQLYHGYLKQQPNFNIKSFSNTYKFNNFIIHTLPGVFNRYGLDAGSNLLLSTFMTDINKYKIKGKVLDVGCGNGILSTILSKYSPNVSLWLCDVHAAAIKCSKDTLLTNGLKGKIFPSNIFSDVNDRFDLIISNPPFHEGIQNNFTNAYNIIHGSIKHLNYGGELRIVANSFLPYENFLNQTFGNYKIIAKNNRFKVYSAIRRDIIKHY